MAKFFLYMSVSPDGFITGLGNGLWNSYRVAT